MYYVPIVDENINGALKMRINFSAIVKYFSNTAIATLDFSLFLPLYVVIGLTSLRKQKFLLLPSLLHFLYIGSWLLFFIASYIFIAPTNSCRSFSLSHLRVKESDNQREGRRMKT